MNKLMICCRRILQKPRQNVKYIRSSPFADVEYIRSPPFADVKQKNVDFWKLRQNVLINHDEHFPTPSRNEHELLSTSTSSSEHGVEIGLEVNTPIYENSNHVTRITPIFVETPELTDDLFEGSLYSGIL